MTNKNSWKNLHENMGCPGCFYVNQKWLYEGACCTYPGPLEMDENGKCLKRKEADEARLRELQGVDTNEYSLSVFQCKCGFHIGFDSDYLEKMGEVITSCPSCQKTIQILTERGEP